MKKIKKISTKTHGIIDYASAVGMLVLPRVLRWDPAVTRLLTGSALLTTVYSMLTKYELGVFKVLPMKGHLALDTIQSATLASAPFMFVNTRRAISAALMGISLFEAVVTMNTESRPKRKFLWFKY